MTFHRVRESSPLRQVSYNSPTAKSFLDKYNEQVKLLLLEDASYVPSKSFAPSSFRCKRQQWFRLRGTKPDVPASPNVSLDFAAFVGTKCHERVQETLKSMLKDKWLDVETYLQENPPKYEYTLKKRGYETKVSVVNPPVHFSCDGLVEVGGTVHLLEIKTATADSLRSLVGPKSEHLNQVLCYCTLLGLDDALVLYQDRQYGDTKCFTHHVTDTERQYVVDTFNDVLSHVESNMVPDALPKDDKWCDPSYCRYYQSCRKWGR